MRRPLLVTLTLIVLGFVVTGYVLDRRVSARDETYRYLSNFADTLDLIRRNYVEKVEMPALVDGAYRGLLEELDPESFYLTPDSLAEFERARKVKSLHGIGIDVSKMNGYAVVVSVLPGSPADEHLSQGDYLRMVDHHSTRPLNLFEVRQRLRGEDASDLHLKVVHRDDFETEQLTIKRAPIAYQALRTGRREDGVLTVRLLRVDKATVQALARELRDQEELAGVILDLRGCSRGDVTAGARLADLFIDSGSLMQVAGKTAESEVEGRLKGLSAKRSELAEDAPGDSYQFEVAANPDRSVWRGPLAVISDRGTAGAAEVATAALSDHERARVVGRRTFGRGSLQAVIRLDDGAAVRLTVARIIAPDGESLLGRGVEPDEAVETALEDGSDPALEEALRQLQKDPAEEDGGKKKAA